MAKCKHTDTLWGRCTECGLTRDEQVRLKDAADRITLRARSKVKLRGR